MDLKIFKLKFKKTLRQTTLCFLIREDKVLLAMKKRGFGKGRYNGVGGKPKDGESIEKCAIREAREEIGIVAKNIKKIAVLDFYFPHAPLKENWNQQVIVFVSEEWQGKPKETDEMKPKWFVKYKLPFSKMWADDILWLPHVLTGKRVKAEFSFSENQKIEEYSIKIY